MTQSDNSQKIEADIKERIRSDFEKFEELRGFL